MKLRGLAFVVLCALAFPAAAAEDQEVTLGALHGSLLLPDKAKDYPAVLIIAGSGPTDRDGNSPLHIRAATYKLIAQGLAAEGIASLRFDKRGIAASAAAMTSEQDLRFDTYVDDAVAWTEFLKSQPKVTCVFILGHSEGALIGALTAAKVRPCGFISASGTGEPAGVTLTKQLKARGLPEVSQKYVDETIAHLEHGEAVADVPPAWQALFRPSVQPYLISWFAKDPQAAIKAVKAPVLILQGTTDVQVSVEDAKLLAAAQPRAKLVLLEGVNHVLKLAPADFATNIATYADPSLPLAPAVMPAIVGFVKR